MKDLEFRHHARAALTDLQRCFPTAHAPVFDARN